MRCHSCEADNKEAARICRKCGMDLSAPKVWRPTWRWHAKTLLVIYVVLVAAYLTINTVLDRLPAPYRPREVPKELTPWLFPAQR